MSNLSNTRAYEYTSEDVEKMIRTLKSSISDLEHSFKLDKKNNKFSLK